MKVSESNAAKACRDIGARLPTPYEIDTLIESFDHYVQFGTRKLTNKGLAEMEAKFGDDSRVSFWSSWIDTNNSFYKAKPMAHVFTINGEQGLISNGFRGGQRAVRCVQQH